MDTSFFTNAENVKNTLGAVPGPLDMAAKMQALQQGDINLQGSQMALAAKQAIGPIIQKSIDPQTGELDYNKAFVGLASNPATAWMANDMLSQWTQRQLTQADTAVKELELHKTKLDLAGNIISGLLPLGDNIKLSDVMGALALAKGQKVLDDGEVAQLAQQFASKGEAGPQLAKAVQAVALGLSGSKNAIEQTFGTFEQRNQTMEGIGPQGAKGFTTKGEQLGIGSPGQGNPMQLPGAVPPPSAENPLAENPPGAPMAQRPGGQTGAGVVPGSSPSFHNTSVPEPYAQYYRGEGQIRDYEKKMVEEQNVVNQQLVMIHDAQDAMKHFKQGPGMSTRMEAAKAMDAMGLHDVASTLMGAGKADDPISNAQAFQKMMIISSMETLRKTLGGQGRITNLEFEKFEKALPSIETQPGAIEKIFNYMKKLAALSRAENEALSGENGYVRRHLSDPFNPQANFSLADFNRRFTAYATKKKLLPSLVLDEEK